MRLFSLFVLFLLAYTQLEANDSPPNVVLIISDDQTWTDYGFMGHQEIRTPHLDQFADECLAFPRGYVPTSLCCPSLASIISGLTPRQHRVTGNEPPKPAPGEVKRLEEFIAPVDHMPLLPKMLGEKGYVSFQSGKWWLGHHQRGGFTEGMTHGDPSRGGRHGDDGLKIGREGMDPIFEFIDAAEDQPFFVWYAPFLPHSPHNPPQRLLDHYLERTSSIHVARYWAMCEWFDETCGQLLDHLDERDLRENTLVIYVTDNGWIQDTESPRYADRSKRSPHDGGLRTPILVRWPEKVAPGRITTPVSSLDIVPTVLAATGLEPTPEMSGINLLDREAVLERRTLFGDSYLHDALSLEDPEANLTYRWCLSDGWKLILPHQENVTTHAGPGARGTGEIELYQVENDPFETINLASDRPDVVQRLTALIENWWDRSP